MITPNDIQKDKIKTIVKELSIDQDIVEFVSNTEKRLATTQDHYGDYMNFLSKFDSRPGQVYIMAMALKAAGANVAGVNAAVRILKG